MKKHRKFKKGAAAYYIVAFSTLILVVIATSFALVMLSEARRTSNDELSQSAYDAALVGVEDAKIAFANYRRCVETGASSTKPTGTGTKPTCGEIIYWVKNPDCYTVGHILGRIDKSKSAEVDIGGVSTGSGDTSTNQAYTCTTINANLSDYRSTLSSTKKRQTMRAEIGNGASNNVSKIRINWYSVRTDAKLSTKNFLANDSKRQVTFGGMSSANGVSVPPTLELQIVQTASTFKMSDFDKVDGNKTNRATLYLVPTTNENAAKKSTSDSNNYIKAYDGSSKNAITRKQVAKTNDHTASNKPFLVYCNGNSTDEFYCSADITLPYAYGGTEDKRRNNKTFMISVSLPYQQPDTDFSLEFFCDSDDTKCGGSEDVQIVAGKQQVKIKNTQIAIDSTGRANDLYRRVETRLEASDTTFGNNFPNYALEILGDDGVSKALTVGSEYDFDF